MGLFTGVGEGDDSVSDCGSREVLIIMIFSGLEEACHGGETTFCPAS
jgi:hypothetical protein